MQDFAFIHNPKTGGETVEALLGCDKNHDYVWKRKEEIENRYSFTFVRHPVSRMTSWYRHLLKHRYYETLPDYGLNSASECFNILEGGGKMGPVRHRKLAEKMGINEWIKAMMADIEKYSRPQFGPLSHQYLYVFDQDAEEQLVTDVFRFEQYEEGLKAALNQLGRDHLISKIAKSNHSRLETDPLNDESMGLIADFFKRDFELFGYSP